jgi:hypothetical protein
MLVDVIPLRRNGVKRPSEELRAATPIRGYLTVDTVVRGPAQARLGQLPTELARIWRSDLVNERAPLVALSSVRVTRMGGDALLVTGIEKTPEAPEGHPQSWWCWLVLSDEQARSRRQVSLTSIPLG